MENQEPKVAKTEKIHAVKTSLKSIMAAVNANIFEIENVKNIRIFNPEKPEFKIIIVEADISEDLINFLNVEEELSSDNEFKIKDIKFESTVYDFVMVKMTKDSDTKSYKLNTISVLDLLITDGVIDNINAGEWDFTLPDFSCIEIMNEGFVNDIEKLELDKTDMKFFG